MGYVAVVEDVECAIDVSDGLLQDIGHVCESSGVGAILRAADVPISHALRSTFPDDALRLACTGGEDYELALIGDSVPLLTLAPTIIGEIVDDPEHRVRLLDEGGNEITFERGGWDAFR
jgi:thiamine-monophosphate kinase